MVSTVRVLEIAEILGVTHQRATKIVDEGGSPQPIGRRDRADYGIGARSQRGRRSGGVRSPGGCILEAGSEEPVSLSEGVLARRAPRRRPNDGCPDVMPVTLRDRTCPPPSEVLRDL